MNIEKLVFIGELFQIYSPLLTDKQREIVSLYYEEDYSLGEISEQYGVSRQSVHDTLKRSEKILKEYDEKLNLLSDFQKQNNLLEKALDVLNKVKKDEDNSELEELERILRRLLR